MDQKGNYGDSLVCAHGFLGTIKHEKASHGQLSSSRKGEEAQKMKGQGIKTLNEEKLGAWAPWGNSWKFLILVLVGKRPCSQGRAYSFC